MPEVVPPPFLFRFALPVRRCDDIPKRGKFAISGLDLSAEFALPDLSELRGVRPFGEVRAAWNDEGLGFSVLVRGKKHPPAADERMPTMPDGVQLWIDTRNTQTIHRASRYCHHFCFASVGGGSRGEHPFGTQLHIAQAREPTTLAAKGSLLVRSESKSDGYRLEIWLRRDQLQGFDPAADRETGTPTKLGFFYEIRDSELGDQTLTVDSNFPFAYDPSLWSTLELIS
jgi:hypothetical protein